MRLKIIDFIRALAIIFVLGFHCPPLKPFFYWGWAGVDLFFVLSGFLVSGLLFNEYKKSSKINASLFLIRRGFKIYPAFYCYIVTMLFINYLNTLVFKNPSHFEWKRFFAEIFFFQNYVEGLQPQTWSLGIEEHFYIFLTFTLVLFIKLKAFNFRSLIFTYFILFSVAIFFRERNFNVEFDFYQSFYPTHLRMDALFFGVLISYAYNFHQMQLLKFIKNYQLILFILGFLFISPIFFFSEKDFFMNVFGLPLLYMGFGILMIIAISIKNIDLKISNLISSKFYNAMAYLGVYSYSIYLWHLGIPIILFQIISKFIPSLASNLVFTLVYLVSSISIGIIMGRIVEIPFLKIRDRYFPKESRSLLPLT